MNNFTFKVLGNYSPNIQTFGKKASSCYRLYGMTKTVFLDFGAGIFKKFIEMVEEEKLDFNNIVIIVSHNHVDHSFSLFPLALYLRQYNRKYNTNKKVELYMPARSCIFTTVKKFEDVFNINILSEETTLKIDKMVFTFCRTSHCGESYATKIKRSNKVFVYTSDLPYYTEELENFVRNADIVLVDAGYPKKRTNSFKNYHGRTKTIIKHTQMLDVKKIYATHRRFRAGYFDYQKCFSEEDNVELVSINNEYSIFE